ncbi:MAG: hypothetical protein EXS25_02055 [Pedosphaera sp.]|nr:hypothetical protein [Pedosphaera sp.]
MSSTDCFACHQMNGRGLPRAFPTLIGSDYHTNDIDRSIRILAKGLSAPITVNGRLYNGMMPTALIPEVHMTGDRLIVT